MKVEYMQPFVEAACAVLERISAGPARAGALSLLEATFASASVNVAAQVSGSLRGEVVYNMSSPTAKKLVGLIAGDEARGFGWLLGIGMARFGAMLGEETVRLLAEGGHQCQISGPLVFRAMNVEFALNAPGLSVPIETDAGQVHVNVAVCNGKQA